MTILSKWLSKRDLKIRRKQGCEEEIKKMNLNRNWMTQNDNLSFKQKKDEQKRSFNKEQQKDQTGKSI